MRTRQPLLLRDCMHHTCLGHEASITRVALHPAHPLGVTLDTHGKALLWHLSPCSPLTSIAAQQVCLEQRTSRLGIRQGLEQPRVSISFHFQSLEG